MLTKLMPICADLELQIDLARLRTIEGMGRGWESKAIEQQQDEAASSKSSYKPPLTAEQIAAERRRQSIELSRQRISQQLQVACNPRHRQMLEAALADLDRQLGAAEKQR